VEKQDAMKLVPPVWGVIWGGVQTGLVMLAGGRRRFKGQRLIAGALEAGSLALGATALGLFKKAGTTSIPMDPSATTALVTDGVYAYSRNPMYLSILLGLLAGTVASGRLRTLVAIPGLILSLQPQIEAEESALAKRFGSDYAEYRQRVRRWL